MNTIVLMVFIVVRLKGGRNKTNNATPTTTPVVRVIDPPGQEMPMQKDVTGTILALLILLTTLSFGGAVAAGLMPWLNGSATPVGLFIGACFLLLGLIATLAIKQVSEEQKIILEVSHDGRHVQWHTLEK